MISESKTGENDSHDTESPRDRDIDVIDELSF